MREACLCDSRRSGAGGRGAVGFIDRGCDPLIRLDTRYYGKVDSMGLLPQLLFDGKKGNYG